MFLSLQRRDFVHKLVILCVKKKKKKKTLIHLIQRSKTFQFAEEL